MRIKLYNKICSFIFRDRVAVDPAYILGTLGVKWEYNLDVVPVLHWGTCYTCIQAFTHLFRVTNPLTAIFLVGGGGGGVKLETVE